MSKITELQEKRARIWKQAKDFLDTKQKEADVLSAEDNEIRLLIRIGITICDIFILT